MAADIHMNFSMPSTPAGHPPRAHHLARRSTWRHSHRHGSTCDRGHLHISTKHRFGVRDRYQPSPALLHDPFGVVGATARCEPRGAGAKRWVAGERQFSARAENADVIVGSWVVGRDATLDHLELECARVVERALAPPNRSPRHC